MFAVATTNMVLRGDGKSNLNNEDFLKQNPKQLQTDCEATVGFMNPPYSQGKVDKNLTEISFTEHLCNSILKGGKVIVIIPQSAVTGKTKEEKAIKESILKKHTLEGVITLNKNTFYRVGTNPCIAIFTAGIPHDYKNKVCKFINFEDDGFEVQKHKGLIKTIHAKDRKEYLLKVWRDETEAETKFCVKTTIEAEDEWLHSFYYFNDEIPKEEDFEKTMADYLTFEFNMIMQGRDYIFKFKREVNELLKNQFDLNDVEWKEFKISKIFDVRKSRAYHKLQLQFNNGDIPYITRTSMNNGLEGIVKNEDFILNPKDTISCGAENADFFYQGTEYISGNNVCYLKNNNINRYTGLFFDKKKQKINNRNL